MAPPSSILSVPNVTAHPSTASVPITVLLHNGPLLRGFNVPIKGLIIIQMVIIQMVIGDIQFAVCIILSFFGTHLLQNI